MIYAFRIIAAGLLLFCAGGSARADAVDDYIAAQMRQLRIPGVSLAVVREGRIVKAQGYGLASAELRAPVTAETVFEIGSITKQFTAVAIMMLVEEGKIGLDDPINKYLNGVPAAWSGITVRHLLTHTSGIQNYLDLPDLPDIHRAGLSHDAIADLFFKELRLEFEPGETWAYSNSAYLLLGNIIERVSGQSYWEFLRARIFAPLGMNATRSSAPNAIIPHRAAGYGRRGDGIENRPPLAENAYAAGSIVSTARDLAKWDAALYTDRLLRRATLEQMRTPAVIRSGATPPFNYGFGWFIDAYHGRHVISHSGGTPGFSAVAYHFAADRLTVIVLTNNADAVIDHWAIDIAGMFVPTLARPAGGSQDPDPATTQRLRRALSGVLSSTPDAALFTPAMQVSLRAAYSRGLWPWVAADGELRSFVYSESERVGDNRILRYRAELGSITRWFSFAVTGDGEIAQLYWW